MMLLGVVELGRLRQMGDVAGVDHEGRLDRQRLDLVDGFFQRAERIGVGRLVEADMAVADLQEGERRPPPCGMRLADQAERARHAARDRPEHAGAGPGHAFQHLAAAQAVDRRRWCDRMSSRLPVGFGCSKGLDRARPLIYSRPARDLRKPLQEFALEDPMKFLDEAKIYIRSGDGGNGCVAFRREKFIEFGGPERRRRRQGRRRHRGRGRRPQYPHRLPLPAAFQGQARPRRHGQGPPWRRLRRRDPQGAGRNADLRGGRRDPAGRSHHGRADAPSSPTAAMAASAMRISSRRPTGRRATPIRASPARSASSGCGSS